MVFDDSNLAGYIGGVHEVCFMGDTFLIEDFFVVNDAQGKGIGTEILEWFENHPKEKHVVMTRLLLLKFQNNRGTMKKENIKPSMK